MDPTEVAAREAIRDRLATIAQGEDRRDADTLKSCYWPEARLDYGIFAGSLPEYLGWVVPGSPAVILTLHTLGQSLIRVSGNTAKAETHIASYHRVDASTGHRDMMIAGRYLDRFEQRGAEWRVLERTMIYDYTVDQGESADWSRGLMGTPFHEGGSYTGTTLGDPGAAFLK